MIGNLLSVTKTELENYLRDSSLLEHRIYNDETEDPDLVDIDKAWEGILFLLTGQCLAEADHPLMAVLFSGQMIDDDQDLGFGPAHYVTPAQVVELNDQISKLTITDLQQRFDPVKMTELGIYPDIWSEGTTDNNRPAQIKTFSAPGEAVFKANITLQTEYLQESTKETTAAVMIHEVVHGVHASK
jgi:hypothetical protein